MLKFLAALGALLILGGLIALFAWMVFTSIGQALRGPDHEARRDRVRPTVRDV